MFAVILDGNLGLPSPLYPSKSKFVFNGRAEIHLTDFIRDHRLVIPMVEDTLSYADIFDPPGGELPGYVKNTDLILGQWLVVERDRFYLAHAGRENKDRRTLEISRHEVVVRPTSRYLLCGADLSPARKDLIRGILPNVTTMLDFDAALVASGMAISSQMQWWRIADVLSTIEATAPPEDELMDEAYLSSEEKFSAALASMAEGGAI